MISGRFHSSDTQLFSTDNSGAGELLIDLRVVDKNQQWYVERKCLELLQIIMEMNMKVGTMFANDTKLWKGLEKLPWVHNSDSVKSIQGMPRSIAIGEALKKLNEFKIVVRVEALYKIRTVVCDD